MLLVLLVFVGVFIIPLTNVNAQTVENPQSGSVGLTGTVPGPPPDIPAVIDVPSQQEVLVSTPTAVRGECVPGTIIQISRNGAFAGSVLCLEDGTFQLQIDLLPGLNTIIASTFDALNQQGPDSAPVIVNYQPQDGGVDVGQNIATISPFVITSNFGARGVNPGDEITWPLSVSGGVAPYAISIDWGDGSEDTLLSLDDSGEFNPTHVYDQSGTYSVTVKATDADGRLAFVQVLTIVNGPAVGGITQEADPNANVVVRDQYVLWPIYALVVCVFVAFVIGRSFQRWSDKHKQRHGGNLIGSRGFKQSHA